MRPVQEFPLMMFRRVMFSALTLEHFYGRAVRGLPPGVGPGGEAGDEPGDGDAAGQSRAGNRQLAKQQTVEAQRQRSRQ